MYFQADINSLLAALRQQGIILYPTETVWGLGADIFSAPACERILQLKNRPTEKKFIILVNSFAMLQNYVENIPQKAALMIEHYEKPLTIIYDQPKNNFPPYLLSPDGSVAIRVTKDAFCNELIAKFGFPIVSTSANLSGEPFPSCFADIPQVIVNQVDAVSKYKQKDKNVYPPSAIVKIQDGQDLLFIRK